MVEASRVAGARQASSDEDSTSAATFTSPKTHSAAAAKWRQEEGDYRDDITAIVVVLRGLFANTSAEAAAP